MFQKYRKYIPLLIPIAVCIPVLCILCPDTDFSFIAATGRWIVENKAVPTTNPFVIHEDFRIIVQQWLFDVLMWLLYDAVGEIGLIFYSIVIFLGGVYMVWRFSGYFTGNDDIRAFVCAVGCYVNLLISTTRPSGLTFIILMTELCLLEERRKGNRKAIWFIPLLSLLEVNLHASFWPFLFVFGFCYLFSPDIQKLPDYFTKNKDLFACAGVSFLAGFLNPYGLRGMFYLFLSYNSAAEQNVIQELSAASTGSITGLYIIVGASILIYYFARNTEKADYTRDIMLVLFFIFALMHQRNVWLFYIALIPAAMGLFKEFHFPEIPFGKNEAALNFCYGILLAGTVGICIFVSASVSDFTVYDSSNRPVEAADYLDEYDGDITLYTYFNCGAYMELRGYQVYMDARPELFQSAINGKEDIYTEYLEVYLGTADFEAFLEKYDFTHIIVQDDCFFDLYLSLTDGYEVVLEGDGYKLYEQKETSGFPDASFVF